jgi:hypothetical protein
MDDCDIYLGLVEILDTATGAMVRCAWADEEAYRRSLDRPTVADRGVW